jgi:signal transduction histidine kinase
MARELHDVIGHNISLINLQASVGLDLIEIRPDQARDALSAIKMVSKEALSELRSLLESLRQAGDDAPRSPAPGLGHLPELIEATRSSGLSVTTEVQGIKRPLPAAVDLAAYRIIQESVTNVTRHAGPARVTIRLCYTSDSLQIEILDDGRPLANRSSSSGSGTGIAGMRERALALGGRLEAGRRTGAGFAVTAELPIREPA